MEKGDLPQAGSKPPFAAALHISLPWSRLRCHEESHQEQEETRKERYESDENDEEATRQCEESEEDHEEKSTGAGRGYAWQTVETMDGTCETRGP